ncbi:MAG: hydrolase [Candidatus Bathyarchaeia archaeon]|jgi:hypothetical protein
MPFTPLHLGPALAVGLPLRRWLHAPTFIVANVILDVEPLAVMVFGLNNPLHGILHTFLLATAVGLLLGFVMFKLEKPMQLLYRKIQLETNRSLKLQSFLLAGVFGTALHVVFDALLYSEMTPFFPLTINPLLTFHTSMLEVYLVCVWLGVFGIAYYGVLIAYSLYKKR